MMVVDAASHETMHYIQAIQEYIGTRFDNETEAYLMGSTLTSILRAFQEWTKLPKKRKYK